MQKRLESKGLPKGVAVLLYGAPGTGKTETVYQLAKKTNRKILHVDIAESKSMWFGESEKIIKKIFTNYRQMCKAAERHKENTPILLPLEKEMATHSSILAWEIPRTKEPLRLQSMGWQRTGHD